MSLPRPHMRQSAVDGRSLESNPMPELDARLKSGLRALGLEADADTRATLLSYLALLSRWGRVYNLTGVMPPTLMLSRHLLDSLAVTPYVIGPRVLDIGTGAGLPGLPLAICNPEWEFVLLDSRGKKTRFVQQAVIELGLKNVAVAKSRVEDYRPNRPFDTLLARAFGRIERLAPEAVRLGRAGGRLICLKGELPRAEIERLSDRDRDRLDIHELRVPQLNAKRHLVIFQL